MKSCACLATVFLVAAPFGLAETGLAQTLAQTLLKHGRAD